MDRNHIREQLDRERLIARERAENQSALAEAKATGRNTVFLAEDGCEVTVTPAGHVFHNVGDWW